MIIQSTYHPVRNAYNFRDLETIAPTCGLVARYLVRNGLGESMDAWNRASHVVHWLKRAPHKAHSKHAYAISTDPHVHAIFQREVLGKRLPQGNSFLYVIFLRALGQGSFNECYEVLPIVPESRAPLREVAYRVLKKNFLSSANVVSNWEEERQALEVLAQLPEPHSAHVLMLPLGFVQMPYERGMFLPLCKETLLSMMLRQGPMDEEKSTRIGIHVMEGLSLLHHYGFVHNDLKPDNILYDFDTRLGIPRIRIADFGAISTTGSIDRLFRTTFAYEPSNRWFVTHPPCHHVITEEVDLFGAALILYSLSYGVKTPWFFSLASLFLDENAPHQKFEDLEGDLSAYHHWLTTQLVPQHRRLIQKLHQFLWSQDTLSVIDGLILNLTSELPKKFTASEVLQGLRVSYRALHDSSDEDEENQDPNIQRKL